MKVPQARKLPSGSWFVRVTVDGVVMSITKPTEKEAIAEAMAFKSGAKAAKKSGRKPLTQAIDEYIAARENILSPSTIAGYKRIQRQRFAAAMPLDIHQISQEQWQRFINLESKKVSPKTIKNAWGFLSSVIYEQTGSRPTVRLPQKVENKIGFLSHEDIPKFLDAIRGDDAEIPALLALSSLRQSEILGLRWDAVDIQNNVIWIRETAVRDKNGVLVHKETTKNSASRRAVPIIAPLRSALEKANRDSEYVVNMGENTIRRHYKDACNKAGVPYVKAHGLRHSFASLCYYLGVDEITAMRIGGWADLSTMRGIYTHMHEADIAQRSQIFTSFFNETSTAETR